MRCLTMQQMFWTLVFYTFRHDANHYKTYLNHKRLCTTVDVIVVGNPTTDWFGLFYFAFLPLLVNCEYEYEWWYWWRDTDKEHPCSRRDSNQGPLSSWRTVKSRVDDPNIVHSTDVTVPISNSDHCLLHLENADKHFKIIFSRDHSMLRVFKWMLNISIHTILSS